jgi:hypothetical protein
MAIAACANRPILDGALRRRFQEATHSNLQLVSWNVTISLTVREFGVRRASSTGQHFAAAERDD